ncbi:RDD family protein [Salinibacillus xinjiangensis]|uniref:RDD family protein n=1 Tax=Salinibacillus xinjiangensis TaxID=1229268 RepID=A0A6G1XA34_9BACI|nr:RDD family protein [Salinibacillus xinjiangensis]MRG87789.1 RDD family protein [Salinibacillus xinjiangensis]
MERPAGFWLRFVASILDSLIIGFIFGIVTFITYGEFYLDAPNVTDLLSVLYMILVPVFWRGYVIGKRIMNIRIVKVSGDNVTIGTMLLRVLLGGFIYAITLGIGLIISAFMVGLGEEKRAIHDYVAGTYVKRGE